MSLKGLHKLRRYLLLMVFGSSVVDLLAQVEINYIYQWCSENMVNSRSKGIAKSYTLLNDNDAFPHRSPTRPSVFFLGRSDGVVDIWDMLERCDKPVATQKVNTYKVCILPVSLSKY